jgi:hypothetical protein
MHGFKGDFYGIEMRAIVLGYIRPELNYTSRGEQAVILLYHAETECSYRCTDRRHRERQASRIAMPRTARIPQLRRRQTFPLRGLVAAGYYIKISIDETRG